MSKRVSPVQRLQAEIDGVFTGGEDLAGAIEEVARLGARLLLQTAIEAEVAAFLGRDVAALSQPEVREPMETLMRTVRSMLTTGLESRADPRAPLWAAATLRGLSEAMLTAPPDCDEQWLREQLLDLGRHMVAGYRRTAQRRPAQDLPAPAG